jgi:hypothetical protein
VVEQTIAHGSRRTSHSVRVRADSSECQAKKRSDTGFSLAERDRVRA